MKILGISAFYHDSAACLVVDGSVVAAAQEERFSRKKHDAAFPRSAINYCLRQGNIDPKSVDSVVYYEKPFLKFERLLETYLAVAPRGFSSFCKSLPAWVKDKLFQKSNLISLLREEIDSSVQWRDKLLFSEHHLSHAASAFFPSPFTSAAILTLDGVGEWTTSSLAHGSTNDIQMLKEIHFPHSLGLLYSAFTYYTGFKVNSGEYKVMGLAPYGEPKYVDEIKDHLINVADDGSFQLDMSYFGYASGLRMTNEKFAKLFGGEARDPESELTQREMDLAASVQKVTEEVVVKLARSAARETGARNLCLAGGVALNCVANGILVRHGIFENVWIQPAAGDAGGALGAALATYHMHNGKPRLVRDQSDSMKGSYLGPEFTNTEIEEQFNLCGANFHFLTDEELIEEVVSKLIDEKAIGWMQGRMEFGPRALGARSILADPRSPVMQKQLNLKVKFRESFRPFAPSVLAEHSRDWFDLDVDSPYMLMVAEVSPSKRIVLGNEDDTLFGIDKLNVARSKIPAVTHVDFSARIQTVHRETNPTYHALISRFYEKTGCPVLVNTSFNVRGEPIVCSPIDAFRCFMGTNLDLLVVGNFVLYKEEQDSQLIESYLGKYELD